MVYVIKYNNKGERYDHIQSVFATVKALGNGHEATLQAAEEFFSTLEPVFENTLI